MLSLSCVLRHTVHRAADQSCGGHWGHTDGSSVWLWCCKLSLYIHVLFPEVSLLSDT